MRNKKVQTMAFIALFIALIAIMSFTPLGYLKIGTVEMTLIGIPVIVGGIIFGPKVGTILGFTFGISSFIQCFTGSVLGEILLGINPILTFVTCVVPRTLMGLFVPLIYNQLNKTKIKPIFKHVITNMCGSLLNTILFVGTLYFSFYGWVTTNYGNIDLFLFIITFVGINALIEVIVCSTLGSTISLALEKYSNHSIRR